MELTDVLQGHDIPQTGLHGPHCSIFSNKKRNKYSLNKNTNGEDIDEINGNSMKTVNLESRIPYCERWEDMVDDVSRLFEWAVANRLNRIEWLLLGSYKWGDELEMRMKRFKVLTSLGHEYSLLVGADVPLGESV